MCDHYLHCPYCSKRLVALCSIAGDNATGFYVEFFLVKPTGTEGHGIVPAQTRSVLVAESDASAITRTGAHGVVRDTAVQLDAFPPERGFDDDEAPTP